MSTMTEEQAERLIARVSKLSDRFDTARRIVIVLGVVVAVLIAVIVRGSLALGDLEDQADATDTAASTAAAAAVDVKEAQVTNCENANKTRDGQRQIWEFFFEVTIAGNQDAPKAVLDFYDAYVHWITDEVLPDRDCTDLGRVYPEVGPPPSYAKALKEALRDERRSD